jgi:hypothetical protein
MPSLHFHKSTRNTTKKRNWPNTSIPLMRDIALALGVTLPLSCLQIDSTNWCGTQNTSIVAPFTDLPLQKDQQSCQPQIPTAGPTTDSSKPNLSNPKDTNYEEASVGKRNTQKLQHQTVYELPALSRLGSATTFQPRLTFGRYLTFSCSSGKKTAQRKQLHDSGA